MLARQPMPEMTFEAYLEWEVEQEEKWELVDGRPVRRSDRWLLDPVTGAIRPTESHATIVSNLDRLLSQRLRGAQAHSATTTARVRCGPLSCRLPDVTVSMGEQARPEPCVESPVVLFDVLNINGSRLFVELLNLLDEYQTVSSVEQIIYVGQDAPLLMSWRRSGPFWPRMHLEALADDLELPSLDVSLRLADIYSGVEFEDAGGA